jgi:ribA/ribD-fused uncharacterized protein
MITSFTGENEFLSSFYLHPFTVPGCSDWWNTAEHAFQAAKAMDPGDYTRIRNAPSPAKAKRIGREIECRPDWDQIRHPVMMRALLAKFDIPELRQRLAGTGSEVLIEGNTWGDDHWGCVPAERRQRLNMTLWGQGSEWAGENWLGRLLMMVREVQR